MTTVSTSDGGCDTKWDYHRITSVPYPGIPDTLTNESVAAFAEAVERAYIYRSYRYEEHSVRVNFSENDIRIDEPQVNRTDDGWFVHLTGGHSAHICYRGESGVSDSWMSTYYFINESAAYREEAGTNADVDSRVNGTRIL